MTAVARLGLCLLVLLPGCVSSRVDCRPSVELWISVGDGVKPQAGASRQATGFIWERQYGVGEEVVVWLEAVNHSHKTIRIPPSFTENKCELTVMDSAGIGFARKPDADIGSQLEAIDICPPFWETMKPGGKREYRFVWTPRQMDVGEGYLILEMPEPFEKVAPIPVVVEARPWNWLNRKN